MQRPSPAQVQALLAAVLAQQPPLLTRRLTHIQWFKLTGAACRHLPEAVPLQLYLQQVCAYLAIAKWTYSVVRSNEGGYQPPHGDGFLDLPATCADAGGGLGHTSAERQLPCQCASRPIWHFVHCPQGALTVVIRAMEMADGAAASAKTPLPAQPPWQREAMHRAWVECACRLLAPSPWICAQQTCWSHHAWQVQSPVTKSSDKARHASVDQR